jgi:hypothetical protein
MTIVEGRHYYTIAETAALLHISMSTLYRWDKVGQFVPDVILHKSGTRLYDVEVINKLADKRAKHRKTLPLIKTEHYSGYLMDDIRRYLSKDKFKEFTTWVNGQTGAIHKGHLLVYEYDFERFIAYHPIKDTD